MATIQEMRDQADVIYEARQDGENTQIRVGKLFQDIVDYLGGNSPEGNIVYFDSAGDIEVYNGNLLNVGEISANRLNLFEGGGTHSLDVVDGELCYDGVPISDYGGALVEWENIQNKPSVFPTEGTYGTSLSITGDSVKVLNLKSGDDIISTVTLPTAGSMSGYIPYTTNTHGNTSIPYSADINSIALHTINNQVPTSESNLLWVNSLNNSPRLMFNDTNLLSGIHWGPSWNTPMIDEEEWVKLEGSVWANTYKISNYTQREGESAYSYNGGFELQVKDGELWYDNLQVTETVEDIRRLKISGGIEKLYLDNYHRLYLADSEGEPIDGTEVELAPFIPDDLKLTSNHLYLWSNAANNGEGAAIGEGVELPTSGGGGGSSDVIGLPAGSISNGTRVNVSTNKLEVGTASLHNGGSVQGNVLDIRSSDDLRKALCIIDSDNNINFATFFRNSTEDSWTVQTDAKNLKINGHIIGGGTGGGITNVKIAGSAASIQDNYALIPKAGIMQYGVIQIGAYRDAEVTCESVGSLSTTQNYQLQMDNTGKTFVHVPWTSGSGITSGTWAAFFNEKSKGSSDTTGYLYLSNNGVSLQGSTGGLTWTDLNSYDTDSNKIINYSHIPIAQYQKIGGISTGYTSSGNSFALNVDQQHGQGYVTVSKEVFVSSISIQNLCTAFENSTGVLVRKKYNAISQEFDFWVASLYTNTVPDGTYYISTGTGSSTGAAIVKLVISSSRTSFNLSVLVNSHPYYWSFTSEGVKINNSISVTETSTRAIYNSVANKINAIEGNNVIQTISSGNPTETVSNAPNVTLYVPLT